LTSKTYFLINIKHFQRLAKFGLVGTWGFVVNMSILWFLTEMGGLYYLLSSIVAVEIALINNYVLNDLWTWHDRGKSGKREYLKRMLKYHITASAAMLTNISILWFFTELVGIYYLTSNIFGILCGAALNFFVNDRWTFRHRKELVTGG
jgi:dolichol-phosphate mannosyltransferase